MIRMQAITRPEDHAEGAAFAHLAVQLDAAAVQLDDLLGDGQPQAGALRLPGEEVVAAVEPLEDALAIVGRTPGPLSSTSMATLRPARRACTRMRLSPPVYFTALVKRFSTTWPSRRVHVHAGSCASTFVS